MRRFATALASLVLVLAFAAPAAHADGCSAIAQNARGFSYVSSAAVTTTAANVALSAAGTIFALQIGAPSANTDLIYVDAGTATTSTMPVKPGYFECVPFTLGDITLSAISASGTQGVQIVVYYR